MVLYEDSEGTDQDDWNLAMAVVPSTTPIDETRAIRELELTLEHLLPHLTLVIRVVVERVHRPHACPILISIHGVDSELEEASDSPDLESLMEKVFDTQDSYDRYVSGRREEFNHFIDDLESSIRRVMSTEILLRSSSTNIVRPDCKFARRLQVNNEETRKSLPRSNPFGRRHWIVSPMPT